MDNKKKSSSSKLNKIKNVLLNAYENFLKIKDQAKQNSKLDDKIVTPEDNKNDIKATDCNKETLNTFNVRLNLKCKELKAIYLKLYNNLDSFEDLIEKIKLIYIERPDTLKVLDKKREKDTNWYLSNKIIGENIYIDKFAKDIKTAIEKLPYFDKLGINYLNCMLDSTKDNSLVNFSSISKRTVNNLKKFADACTDKNINLGVSISINSTKKTYDWARKAVDGNASFQDMYYCLNYENAKKLDQTLEPKTSSNMFVYSKKIDKYFLSLSNKVQLNLNYNNPLVFNEMIYNMLSLANKGIQAFNLCFLESLFPIDKDTSEFKIHQLLRMFRLIIEIACPGVLLINDTNETQEKSKMYFGTKLKPECHLVNNSSMQASIWDALATGDVRLLKKNISFLNKLKEHQNFINYITNDKKISWQLSNSELEELNINYDEHIKFLQEFYSGKKENSFANGQTIDNGVCGTTASLCGIEKYNNESPNKLNLSVKRIVLLYAFIMALPGVPVINCGDEIATLNDYSYRENEKTKHDLCNLQKTMFDWEAIENLNNKTTQGKVFNGIKKSCSIRKSNKIFASQNNIKLKASGDDSVICFLRHTSDIITLCVFNFSFDEKHIKLSNIFAENLQNHKKENFNQIKLKAYEFKFLKIIEKEL